MSARGEAAVAMDERQGIAVYKYSIAIRLWIRWLFRPMPGRVGAHGAGQINGRLRPISR